MKKTLILGCLAIIVSLCGCAMINDMLKGNAGGGGGTDMLKMELDSLKNAPQPYMIMFHGNPAVGQFATKKDSQGNETTMCIVGGEAGAWNVEERRPSYMDKGKMIVILKVVDDKGLVKSACAAEYVKDAEETPEGIALTVGEKPEAPKVAAAGKAPEMKEEAGPKVAGFDTVKMIMDVQGKPSVTYMAVGAFFAQAMETPSPKGGAVKGEYDGTVTFEYLAQGEDADLCKASVKMPAK